MSVVSLRYARAFACGHQPTRISIVNAAQQQLNDFAEPARRKPRSARSPGESVDPRRAEAQGARRDRRAHRHVPAGAQLHRRHHGSPASARAARDHRRVCTPSRTSSPAWPRPRSPARVRSNDQDRADARSRRSRSSPAAAGSRHLSQDATLLGGAVVRIGSTVYDGSIRAQLQQLKQKLVNA